MDGQLGIGIALAAGAAVAGEFLTGGAVSREVKGLFSGRVRSAETERRLAGIDLDPTGAGVDVGTPGQPDTFLDAAAIQESRLSNAFGGRPNIPNRYLLTWMESWRKLVRALRWPTPDGNFWSAPVTEFEWRTYLAYGASIGSFPRDIQTNLRPMMDAWDAAVALEWTMLDQLWADPDAVDPGNVQNAWDSIRTLASRLDTALDPAGSVHDEAIEEFIGAFRTAPGEVAKTVGDTVADAALSVGELVGDAAAGALEGLATSKLAIVALGALGLWLFLREKAA